MKKECSSASKLLDKYFDHEANEAEKSFIEGHLPDCPTCRRTLQSMGNLRILIKRPVEEAVEREDFPWVWEKIERGIQKRERSGLWDLLKSWLGLTPLLKTKIWIPAVVAAALIVLIAAPLLYKKISSYPALSVVEYVESNTYNVMVYELENQKVTVIWLFNGLEEEASTS
ncbi:MAG: zf-HC2 domain-containing protein [Thermodesulfobacteriota bacterium]